MTLQFVFSTNCQLDISIYQQMPNRPNSKHLQTELPYTPQSTLKTTHSSISKIQPIYQIALAKNLGIINKKSFLYIPYPTYFQIDPKYDHFHNLHWDHCSPQLPTWFLSRTGLYLQPILHSEPLKKQDITPLRSISPLPTQSPPYWLLLATNIYPNSLPHLQRCTCFSNIISHHPPSCSHSPLAIPSILKFLNKQIDFLPLHLLFPHPRILCPRAVNSWLAPLILAEV